MRKKIIIGFLCVVLSFAMLPFGVLAEENVSARNEAPGGYQVIGLSEEDDSLAISELDAASSSTKKWAAAYIRVLKKNKAVIKNAENSFYTKGSDGSRGNFSISFTDVTGDGIPEMFYTFQSNSSASTSLYCKIASYNGKKVKYLKLKYSDGTVVDDIFIAGAPNGARTNLFTVSGSKNLFLKSGTIAGYSFDSITEYKYSKGYMKQVHSWSLGRNNAGEETRSINGKTVSIKKVVAGEKKIVKKINRVLLGNVRFFLSDFGTSNKEFGSNCHKAMSYSKALKWLKKKSN